MGLPTTGPWAITSIHRHEEKSLPNTMEKRPLLAGNLPPLGKTMFLCLCSVNLFHVQLSFIRSSYINVMHLLFYSVNGIPRPPEHTLVAEFRRELTQLRDRVNYLLNRLDTSDDSESPKGEQQQPVEKRNVQGLFPVNNDDSIICEDVLMIFFQHGDIILY